MLQTTTVSAARQFWRGKIEPYGGWPPEQQTFAVGWQATLMTFEQIMNDLSRLITADLRYFRKFSSEHLPDLLQQGWLRLWQALTQNCHLLTSMSRRDAANFVSNRSGASVYRDKLKRYISYDALSRWDDPDTQNYEETISEIVCGSHPRARSHLPHAAFSQHADILMDIARAIQEVAEWCGDDLRKLAALYYITTSVSQTDAGQIAGMTLWYPKNRKPRCMQMVRWTRIVKAKLHEVLDSYKPIEPNRDFWKEQIKAGEVQPVIQMAEKYQDEPMKLLALYVLTTQVGRHTIVEEMGIDNSKLWYACKLIRKELRWLYVQQAKG